MAKKNKNDYNVITDTGVLDSYDNKDQESITHSSVTNEYILANQDDTIYNAKKEESSGCLCEEEMDVETFYNLIQYIRDKKQQAFTTHKEKFFNLGLEYIPELRVDNSVDKKLSPNLIQLHNYVGELNRMFDKFNFDTCLKRIHFLAQSYLETNSFRATYEDRTEKTVPSNYKGGHYFQGRGMKQITHDYNYLAYYDYINNTKYFTKIYLKLKDKKTDESVLSVINRFDLSTINPSSALYSDIIDIFQSNDNATIKNLMLQFYETLKDFAKLVSTDLFHSFNSAGWYISIYTKGFSAMEKDNVRELTRIINGGYNNLLDREKYTKWVKDFFNYTKNCK